MAEKRKNILENVTFSFLKLLLLRGEPQALSITRFSTFNQPPIRAIVGMS